MRVSHGLTASSPPYSAPLGKDSLVKYTPPPSGGSSKFPIYLCIPSFSYLPTGKLIPKSQSHSPIRTRGHLPFWYNKTCLPQTLVFHSVFKGNLCVVLCGMWCPLPRACVYMWLINYCCQSDLSAVGNPVFGQLHNPRVRIPSSPMGWTEGNKKLLHHDMHKNFKYDKNMFQKSGHEYLETIHLSSYITHKTH